MKHEFSQKMHAQEKSGKLKYTYDPSQTKTRRNY